MLTFILFVLPLIGTIFCHIFYAKYIIKDKSTLVPRLLRITMSVLSFIPVIGWITFGAWIYIFNDSNTKFKPNKLTDFFINN